MGNVLPRSPTPIRMELRSRWQPGFWLRHPLISLLLTVLGAVFILLMAAVTAYDTYRLNHYGQPASATVVEVHDGYVVVSFTTADGRWISAAEVSEFWRDPMPRPGDTATIVYDPEQPGQIVRDTRISDGYETSWLILGLGVVFGLGLIVFLSRTWNVWRYNADAWRSGRHSY
jgi:hypothetical protein